MKVGSVNYYLSILLLHSHFKTLSFLSVCHCSLLGNFQVSIRVNYSVEY